MISVCNAASSSTAEDSLLIVSLFANKLVTILFTEVFIGLYKSVPMVIKFSRKD